MNEEIKYLGKIESISFGTNDGRLGLWITLTSDSIGVQSQYTTWDPEVIKVGEYTKWTEEDRDKEMVSIIRKIAKLLKEAKVSNVSELKNIPIQMSFKDNMLNDWRILTEVL